MQRDTGRLLRGAVGVFYRWADLNGESCVGGHQPSGESACRFTQDLVLEKRKAMLSPYVDLDAVRADVAADVPDLLSANTRYQIRRAIRLYEEMGDLTWSARRRAPKALSGSKSCIRLHQVRWTSRGNAGAFARPFFAPLLT